MGGGLKNIGSTKTVKKILQKKVFIKSVHKKCSRKVSTKVLTKIVHKSVGGLGGGVLTNEKPGNRPCDLRANERPKKTASGGPNR